VPLIVKDMVVAGVSGGDWGIAIPGGL